MSAQRIGRPIWLGIAIAVFAFGVQSLTATSYGDTLGNSLIQNLIDQSERGDWRPVAYPTDNFGVGTLYDGTGAGTLLCDTALCLGVADNTTETLKSHGFIAAGAGAPISLSDTEKRSLA